MMMRRETSTRFPFSSLAAFAALCLLLIPARPAAAQAGTVIRDEPTAVQPATEQPKPEKHGGFWSFLEAVCWYIPNRIVDLTDIPRFYITAGDGMGFSVRATTMLEATWFQDDAHCLGWQPRTLPFFTENINERYFGFLAAQQGRKERDKTEIGFSIHFITLGINVAASGSEALDFLLGFVGVDLRGDDHGPVLGWDMTKNEDESTSESARMKNPTAQPAAPAAATPPAALPTPSAPDASTPDQKPVAVPPAAGQ